MVNSQYALDNDSAAPPKPDWIDLGVKLDYPWPTLRAGRQDTPSPYPARIWLAGHPEDDSHLATGELFCLTDAQPVKVEGLDGLPGLWEWWGK